ncbi:MAG: hypothetical protein F6K22_00610 [Okeania sp. SIO2F4]|uniref:hypothetical protein n=1 Tax=Okeania sp. SIO2F4 TaxID=2607790 RepID=UPI00142C808B|nr:hypothetical protein [Okeania sp. SIO2F4]NES01475.1 hypothetical protein [Okeania sp. SIO2F4]
MTSDFVNGRVGRGFDFLGYRFAPGGLAVARVTVERFFERVSRLYEQNATASRIEEYASRWLIWVRSGVQRVGLGLVGAGGSFHSRHLLLSQYYPTSSTT